VPPAPATWATISGSFRAGRHSRAGRRRSGRCAWGGRHRQPTPRPRSARPWATRGLSPSSRPSSGRAPRRRGRARERLARPLGVAGGEHQRAVRVLGDADDRADVDAALAESGRHLRQGPGLVAQLNGEPDHAAPPAWMVPGAAVEGGGEWGVARGVSRAPERRPSFANLSHDASPAQGPTVQMFGLVDSRPTQAALRFFKERRVNVTFVDLRRKPIAPGELRRFVERLGAAALLDTEGRQYKDLGLATCAWATTRSWSGCSPTTGCSGCRSSASATRSRPDRPTRPGRPGWREDTA
jgi:hypothetical protein